MASNKGGGKIIGRADGPRHVATLYGQNALRRLFLLAKASETLENETQGRWVKAVAIHLVPDEVCRLTYRPPHNQVDLLLFVLATQLRDRLPRLRVALFTIIWTLRRLDGQVHCHDEAVDMNILPGSRTVDPRNMTAIHRDLVVGLCLLGGCLPVCFLHPALHHLVHFAQYTLSHGCLRNLWMMCFERYELSLILIENLTMLSAPILFLYYMYSPPRPPRACPYCRYNKHIKRLVRDASHPEAHLARSVSQDVSANYINLAVKQDHDAIGDAYVLQSFVLSCQDPKFQGPAREEVRDLRYLGYVVDFSSISAYKVAHIMGVHFRAGEWNQRPRCGSVVTCVRGRRSYYARVIRFLKLDGDDSPGFASVRWFSKPTYPNGVPLVVRVGVDGGAEDIEFGCILKLTHIHPSSVVIEDAQAGIYYMMRTSGYDRC